MGGKMSKMRCVNCGETSWENVDQFRLAPKGMSICTCCGFVSYPDKWQSYEDIKKHYQGSYRKPPTSGNFYTGQRKLFFHQFFLNSLFSEWKTQGQDAPKVFEVGAAYGMALSWMKELFPKAEVAGTEWTTSYKRVCKHEFGIDLQDDFDDTKKYDLIMSYKVAEHQLDVDKELRRYALSLSENGRLYISVPTWFDSACNFGMSGFDIEYYYDTNHINCWTRDIFEGILARAGLEIIKKDYLMYDSTYLCKRNDELISTPVFKESVPRIKHKMENILEAYKAFMVMEYDKAIELYPDYPYAHVTRAEAKRAELFREGWPAVKKKVIEKAMNDCPTSVDIIVMAGDLAMRAEQWEDAIKYAEQGLKLKPENPVSLSQLVTIMRELALRSDSKGKVHYFTQARNIARHLRDVSAQHQREAIDMIYSFDAQLPCAGEKNENSPA
jgi:tetratricopeptide (TPR) repeat protein